MVKITGHKETFDFLNILIPSVFFFYLLLNSISKMSDGIISGENAKENYGRFFKSLIKFYII
ncbi:hypothetical protein BpHYR1_023481 [Brachionus plicatilis]|uniref:Uncharacterized protein n=1 Tax=Brachionus plicatilis TaxID=10195 RepID=A0A3M7SDP8_BRAPC|nr:hypothetical protein BpHYR1_023481 [Brachionus plicatilis]